MSRKETDLRTRVGELEATVSGLTQELVEANERIRQLEAEHEAGDGQTETAENGPVLGAEEQNGDGKSTKGQSDDTQGDGDAGSDLDDIIVA